MSLPGRATKTLIHASLQDVEHHGADTTAGSTEFNGKYVGESREQCLAEGVKRHPEVVPARVGGRGADENQQGIRSAESGEEPSQGQALAQRAGNIVLDSGPNVRQRDKAGVVRRRPPTMDDCPNRTAARHVL